MLKLFLLLFLWTSLLANIATVVDKTGSVVLYRAGKSQPLKEKDGLLEHDLIKTGKDAKVKIFFRDNTAVSLGQNTSFSIDSYLFDGTKKSNVEFSVVKGFFKTVTGRIGKIAPNRFKLKTKNATIGIRGTVFAGLIGEKKDTIICTDGKIFAKNQFGTLNIDRGKEGTFYTSHKPHVKHYSEKEKLLLIKKAGWKGSKTLKELIAYIKKNFQEPLRGQLLATIQNILNKDGDARRKYLGLQKKSSLKKVINADNISFVDDIHINGREMDSLTEQSIEFYTDDLIDGKVVVDGILESEDKAVKVKDLFVEISIDGGSTWKRAQGHNEWKWSFTPELGQEYEFSLRVLKEGIVSKKEGFAPIVITGASDTDLFTGKEPSSKVYKQQFKPKVITTQPIVLKFKTYTPKVITTQPIVLKFKTYTPKVITTQPIVLKFKTYAPKVITTQPIVLKFKTYAPKVITTQPIVLKFKNAKSSSNVRMHKSALGYKKYNKNMEHKNAKLNHKKIEKKFHGYKLNKRKDYKDGALNGVKDNVHTDMPHGTQRGELPGGLGDKIPTHNGKTDSEITGVDLGGDVGNFDGVGTSGSGVHGEIGDGKRSFQGHGYGADTRGTGVVGVSNHGWNSMNSRAKYNQMTGNGDINNPIGARDTLAQEKKMGFESSKYDEATMTGSPVSASPYLKDGEKLSHNSDDGEIPSGDSSIDGNDATDSLTDDERSKMTDEEIDDYEDSHGGPRLPDNDSGNANSNTTGSNNSSTGTDDSDSDKSSTGNDDSSSDDSSTGNDDSSSDDSSTGSDDSDSDDSSTGSDDSDSDDSSTGSDDSDSDDSSTKNDDKKEKKDNEYGNGADSPDPVDNEDGPVHMTNRQKAASNKVMSHAKSPVSYVGGKNGGRGDGRSPRDDDDGGGMVLIGGGQDAPGDGNPEDRDLHGGYVQGGKVKTTVKEKLGGNIRVNSQ
jgi:hypothetical protein